MMRVLVDTLIYCIILALALSGLKLMGAFDVLWLSMLLPLLVTIMIAVFILTVIIVHDVMSTPLERDEARERRHHRNWGL